MRVHFGKVKPVVIGLIILFGSLPLVWYSVTYGSASTISAKQAIELLTDPEGNSILIDVRPSYLFEQQHITGAQSWSPEQIKLISSPDKLPLTWTEKKIFIICSVGLTSSNLVRYLNKTGVVDSYNIRGGMQEYIAALSGFTPTKDVAYLTVTGEPALKLMSPFEQWSAIIAGFVFKPTYMLLSLLLAIALWKARQPYLLAIKYSMLVFFIGEAWCAVNYLFFNHTSLLSEFFHSYGMVVAFGLALYAISDGIDTHVIKFSAWGQRCSALEICGRCIKNENVDCGIRKVLLLIIPAISILAFIPSLASLDTVSYNTLILNTIYNYTHLFIFQIFEYRYCPILALLLLLSAFLILMRQPQRPLSIYVRLFIAGGLGALGFSFFRLLFGKVYLDNLIWATFWEELTELLFLIATWGVLLLFRHRLLIEVTAYWPWTLMNRVIDLPKSTSLPVYSSVITNNRRVNLIACKIFQAPLPDYLPEGLVQEEYYLDFGLHRNPEQLRQRIQSIIDNLKEPSLVILGYGLCGNGLHGIQARQHMLLIPRVNDCIPIILGSYQTYLEQTKAEPATFYLSQGWLEAGSHPLNEYEEYLRRYTPADADMIINAQYQHCKRLAFVYNNQSVLDAYQEKARGVAQFCQRWGTSYQEILGSDTYIRRLVNTIQEPTIESDDFLIILPGETINSRQFLRVE